MEIGLMWRTNPKLPLDEQLQILKEYYTKKYNTIPNTCILSSGKLLEKDERERIETSTKLSITFSRYLFNKDEVWIGVDE